MLVLTYIEHVSSLFFNSDDNRIEFDLVNIIRLFQERGLFSCRRVLDWHMFAEENMNKSFLRAEEKECRL